MNQGLVVYEHKGSVCCHKVAITLAEKQIEARIVNVALEHQARRRLWARRIDDGLHVPHIAAISFIVAFGQQFRARMNSQDKLDASFNNIADAPYRETIRSRYEADVTSDLLRRSLLAYHGFLRDMEDVLSQDRWLAGDAYSLADSDVVPYLWRLSNLQLDCLWSKLPRVADWFHRVTRRAAFKHAVIDPALPEWIEGMRVAGRRARPQLEPVVEAF